MNGSGRYINDTWNYEGVAGAECVPERYRTNFDYNVRYSMSCSDTVHDVIGKYYKYVNIFAIEDIDVDTELFVEYGVEYWRRMDKYGLYSDPDILLHGSYYEQQLDKACGKSDDVDT